MPLSSPDLRGRDLALSQVERLTSSGLSEEAMVAISVALVRVGATVNVQGRNVERAAGARERQRAMALLCTFLVELVDDARDEITAGAA